MTGWPSHVRCSSLKMEVRREVNGPLEQKWMVPHPLAYPESMDAEVECDVLAGLGSVLLRVRVWWRVDDTRGLFVRKGMLC